MSYLVVELFLLKFCQKWLRAIRGLNGVVQFCQISSDGSDGINPHVQFIVTHSLSKASSQALFHALQFLRWDREKHDHVWIV